MQLIVRKKCCIRRPGLARKSHGTEFIHSFTHHQHCCHCCVVPKAMHTLTPSLHHANLASQPTTASEGARFRSTPSLLLLSAVTHATLTHAASCHSHSPSLPCSAPSSQCMMPTSVQQVLCRARGGGSGETKKKGAESHPAIGRSRGTRRGRASIERDATTLRWPRSIERDGVRCLLCAARDDPRGAPRVPHASSLDISRPILLGSRRHGCVLVCSGCIDISGADGRS